MKRFFCTVCQRIKRVRKYPSTIQNQHAESPANRHGVCAYHSAGNVRVIVTPASYKPTNDAQADNRMIRTNQKVAR